MLQLFQLVKTSWLLLTIITLIAITYLSLSPLANLPSAPGSDKTHHFIAYAALALPIAFAQPRFWLAILLGLFFYSGLIELIQPYVNRYGEWLDWG